MDKKPSIFVFWEYELHPKMLGSPGVMNPDGSVWALNYDMSIERKKLIAIYPLELGQKMWDEVSNIHKNHARRVETLEQALRAEMVRIVPEMESHWKPL